MRYLYTKEQVQVVLKAWHCSEPVPSKKNVVYVCFPHHYLNTATVRRTDLRGTYGKRLYQIDLVHVDRGEVPKLPAMQTAPERRCV